MAKCTPWSKRWPWVVVAVAALVYARVRDIGLIGLDTLPILYTAEFPGALHERLMPNHNMYRPVLSLTAALDKALYGLAAPGHQLTSALTYLAAGLAVGFAALRLVGTPRAALAAALVLMLHPSEIDVVPFVERRSELLMVAFLALVLVAQRKAACGELSPSRPPLLPSVFALLAMGSKDNGLVVLPLGLAVAFAYAPGGLVTRTRRTLWVSLPLIVATTAFGFWRGRIVGGFGGRGDRDPVALLAEHPGQVVELVDRVLRPEPFAVTSQVTGVLLAVALGAFAAAWWLGRGARTKAEASTPWRAALIGLVWIECFLITYAARGVWRIWYVLPLAAGLALTLAAVVEILAARLEAPGRARAAALAGLLALVASVGWQARYGIAFGDLEPLAERTRRLDTFYGELARRVDEAGPGVLIPVPDLPDRIETPPGPGYYDNVRDVTKTTVRAYMWLAYPGERVRMRPTDSARIRQPGDYVLVHPDF